MTSEVCLSFTALEQAWDRTRPNVFLGEWCRLRSRREAWESLDHAVLPFLWGSADKIGDGFKRCKAVYPPSLSAATQLLNRVHEQKKSEGYYHMLLGNWLEEFIHQCYDKYCSLQAAAAAYPRALCRVSPPSAHYVAKDHLDFVRSASEDWFSHQLYSEIVAAAFQSFQTEILPAPEPCQFPGEGLNLRRRFRRVAFGALDRLSLALHDDQRVLVCDPYIGRGEAVALLSLFVRSGMRLAPCQISDLRDGMNNPDLRSRRQAKVSIGNSEFERILSILLPMHVPTTCWESYRRRRTTALMAPLRARAVFTSTGLHSNVPLKFALGETNGAVKVLNLVHGGGYGLDAMHAPKDYESSISDVLFASRWAEKEGGRFLPSAKLSRTCMSVAKQRRDRSLGREGSILLAVNEFPRYLYRFQFHLCSSACVLVGVPEVVQFAKALPDALTAQLKVRVHPGPQEYGWDMGARIRDQVPEVELDDLDVPFERRLAQCRLYVTSQNGTTLLEALAADVPTICYFSDAVYRFSANAAYYLAALRKVGILQPDPIAAAQFAAQVYAEPEQWWMRPDVRRARDAFVQEFAATSSDWESDWIRTITDVAGLSART